MGSTWSLVMSRRAAYLVALILTAEAIIVIGRAPRLQLPQGREVLEVVRTERLRAATYS